MLVMNIIKKTLNLIGNTMPCIKNQCISQTIQWKPVKKILDFNEWQSLSMKHQFFMNVWATCIVFDHLGGRTPLPDPSHHSPYCAPLLARQDQGLRFGGGNKRRGARFARPRPTVAGPNPKPQSWLAAVTIPTRTRTLTLTLTLTLKH